MPANFPSLILGADPQYHLINFVGLSAYALAALGSIWVFFKRQRWYWIFPFAGMTALGLDVRFRFWNLLSDLGRSGAQQLHAYTTRHEWQTSGLIAGFLVFMLLVMFFLFLIRRAGAGYKSAVLGTLLGCFTHLLMAYSQHSIDQILYLHIGPLHVVNLAWITSALLVLFGAFLAVASPNRS